MTTEHPQQPPVLPPRDEPNRLLRAGMYSLAAVAGVATATFKIWDHFYSKMKNSALIKPRSLARYKEIDDLSSKAKLQPMSYQEYGAEISVIEHRYSNDVKKLLKESVGIETDNIVRGTIQRFNALGPFTKTNIAFSGAVALGTTVGAYFLINQNVRLKQELNDVHARLTDVQGNAR